MKKFMIILLFLMCCKTFVYAEEIEEPKVEAQGAILMDQKTGRVLWEKNSETQMAMASTTKIMTAIVALENADINDIVKVSRRAAVSPQVKMNLSKDEEIKLEYLLYALMLQSFNDSAVAIAEHVSGSVEEFCALMTEKAKELGAVNTCFETPSGLDGENHYSTSYDMALITKYALENEEFVRIINTSDVNVSSNKKNYTLVNKNRLLREVEGAKGVKTGFTGKAGHCFVGAVERDGMELISVVLASGWGNKGKNQKWVDTKQILSYGFKTFKYQDIITLNDLAGNIIIERSKTPNVDVCFSEGLTLPLSDSEFKTLEVIIEIPNQVLAPIEAGQKLGVAKIYIENGLEKEIDLIATESATRHDLKTSIEKILSGWLGISTLEEISVKIKD